MGIYMHQHRLPCKRRDAGVCFIFYCEREAFTVKTLIFAGYPTGRAKTFRKVRDRNMMNTPWGFAIGTIFLAFLILCGCAGAPEAPVPEETRAPSAAPWGITLEQFHADLRIQDRDTAIACADGIMNGDLYVDSLITDPVRYSLEGFDWNREETDSPATFQLYLQSLGMVKFLSYAAIERNETSYLVRAADFIEDWKVYEQDEARSANNPKVWYDHGSALRAENLLYFMLVSEELGFVDPPLREQIRDLLTEHAAFLSSDENYTRNHNHGIFQDEALLYIAAALYDHSDAARWAGVAKTRLEEQLAHAFTEEFVHVENSSAYCVGVIELFSGIADFLQSIQDPYGEILNENISAMVDFYARLIMPNGSIVPTGDSFYEKALPEDEAFRNPFLQYILSKGAEGSPPEARSAYYPKSGYFISQETYDRDRMGDATWVMFKAGYVSATHKHADDLSVLLCSKGHEIFIDPGMYNYMNGDPYRDYLISSRAHNSVHVDGQTYSTTVENKGKTGLLEYRRADGYEYVLGFNNMYPGVEIDRHFYSATDVIVLHDDIRSRGQHTYSQTFNLSESMQILSLTPRETVLKIAETDYTVRIRQYGSLPDVTLLRNETDENGNLYGIASDSLNEIHPVNLLKYDLTGSDAQFITVITIEDSEKKVNIGEGTSRYIPAVDVSYEEASNTLFLDTLPVVLTRRSTPDLSDVQWQLQNDKLHIQLPETGVPFEYEWRLLDQNTGEILCHTDWNSDPSAEFSVPECAFLAQVSVRDCYGQVNRLIVGAWSALETDRSFTEADTLNYHHLPDTIQKIENHTYRFTAGLEYSLSYTLRWYIYRNGSYHSVRTIENTNTFEHTFDEPGSYTVSYYVRTLAGDYEYWVLPAFTIP